MMALLVASAGHVGADPAALDPALGACNCSCPGCSDSSDSSDGSDNSDGSDGIGGSDCM